MDQTDEHGDFTPETYLMLVHTTNENLLRILFPTQHQSVWQQLMADMAVADNIVGVYILDSLGIHYEDTEILYRLYIQKHLSVEQIKLIKVIIPTVGSQYRDYTFQFLLEDLRSDKSIEDLCLKSLHYQTLIHQYVLLGCWDDRLDQSPELVAERLRYLEIVHQKNLEHLLASAKRRRGSE